MLLSSFMCLNNSYAGIGGIKVVIRINNYKIINSFIESTVFDGAQRDFYL